jgi:putative intracellular protease/amidase
MVCHAPGILRDAKRSNGEPLVSGLDVTGFSDAGDNELDLSRHLLFSLERALTINGGRYWPRAPYCSTEEIGRDCL